MVGRIGRVFGTLGVLWTTGAPAASIHQVTTYFSVHGSTLEELDRDLGRKGPIVVDTGTHHPAATKVRFDGNVTYKDVPGGCQVDQPNLTLSIRTVLPRWTPPAGVSMPTLMIWDVLDEDIRRHEATHAAIARNWLKRMESALRNLATEPTCEAMRAKVDRVTPFYLARHEEAQHEFDRLEKQRVDRRLHREVRAALRAYAAGD